MALVKDGQGPYAPTLSVKGVIRAFRNQHPAIPFTAENLQLVGVSASLAPRTLQALKLLDLIDDEGNPTAAMHTLRDADNKDYPAQLAEVVRAAYAEIFAYRDPATDSAEEIAQNFRFYRPPSMQPRMVRLFYGLCKEADIIGEVPVIAGGESSGDSPKRTAKPKTAKKQPPPNNPPLPPPPAPRAPDMEGLKARYVEVLLGRLEKADGGFDGDLADRIERLMDVGTSTGN